MKKVVVIGGGPAGMMAAVAAAENGADVTLLEKNEKLGKKLYITGKGRCNLTNGCEESELFTNIVNNSKFLFSAFNAFSNKDTLLFFENEGLELKEERGKRIFPVSDRASDVTRALEKAMHHAGVKVRLNSEVKDINDLDADAIIIATGGVSYKSTGSTGDGYRFAEDIGHSVKEPYPALVPLVVKEDYAGQLEGLSLRNIQVTVTNKKGKAVYKEFGELVFTRRGMSGPVILSAASKITRKLHSGEDEFRLSIDLKPALTREQLDARILKDFSENQNKDFQNSLGKLLPSKLIPVIVRLSEIDPHKKINEVTRIERERLLSLLKDFPFTIVDTEEFNQAIITSGGVNVKEINPKTMQSKLDPRIYFAGEVIDVDAFTGGFNIQIALSTGWLAGTNAAEIQENQ